MIPRHLLVAVLLAAGAFAQPSGRLPMELITTARGLVSDRVTHVVSDSRGYVWIGTQDGVSRFDGQAFVNYTTAEGLPHGFVTTIFESRTGAMYIATLRGLVRMELHATRALGLFTTIETGRSVNDVIEDRAGTIWTGCGRSLCRVAGSKLERDATYPGGEVRVLAAHPNGELWVGSADGLLRRSPNGAWRHYVVQPHRGSDNIHGLAVDRSGQLWISTSFGVFVAAPDTLPAKGAIADSKVRYIHLASAEHAIVISRTAVQARDGSMWVPTTRGALRVAPDGTTEVLDESAGVPGDAVNVVSEDSAGNLWLGSDLGGALRVTPYGVTTFTRRQGLRHDRISQIFEWDGRLCATSGTTRYLQCLEDGGVRTAELVPRSIEFSGWGWSDVVVRDARGEWWVATGAGAVRWPAVKSVEDFARVRPVAVYGAKDGLGGDDVFRIFRDSRGDLWFSTFGDAVLTRRSGGTFRTYTERDGMPLVAPTAFAEDKAGHLWIGLYTGGLVRFDGSRFERFDAADGIPRGFVRDLLVDSRGALWMATNDGVARIDDPAAKRVRATAVMGGALSLAELDAGTIAIGTAQGALLLDVKTGRTIRVSTRDGLPQNEVVTMHRDRAGALWLGTVSGLSRLGRVPPSRALPPPRPRLTSIEGRTVNELGTHDAGTVRLSWPDRRMSVAFSAPDLDARNPLHFEYRLDGEASWTNAGTQRNVTYERLPFGAHRFEVRSVSADGRRSPAATLALDVVPPFWRRAWFVALVLAAIAAAAIALHRLRVSHLLALQEMRMRVATDLHDDLGSSLSRISILTELAKRRRDDEHFLEEIGSTARTLVDSLGDTIWSIDPRRDDVQSMMARVRHFAADVLEAKSIAMDFDVPPALAGLHLTPEKRRELFLLLKEAIHNAARHSQASRVSVTAGLDSHRLRIAIEDDGIGIRGPRDGGHGLPSMTARAARAGGTLDIGPREGSGTRIEVVVPI